MTARGSTRGGPVASPALVRASGGRQHSSNFPLFDPEALRPEFERPESLQSFIDVATLIVLFLLGIVTAGAIVISLFILFFVRL